MLEVEQSLLKQKEEFAMKIESLSQRREELARKESQLKESLLKFDRFLQVQVHSLQRKTMQNVSVRRKKQLKKGKVKKSRRWRLMN
jgi:hypothetical protein